MVILYDFATAAIATPSSSRLATAIQRRGRTAVCWRPNIKPINDSGSTETTT